MPLEKFVAEHNVTNFRRQLEEGSEAPRRATLLDLLRQEEEMLGLTDEQLRRINRHAASINSLRSKSN